MGNKTVYGFIQIAANQIEELKATATLWEHVKSGAQFLSIQNADENKSFAITFRTLPTNDTGVAHILEHSVLNGSRKYPVKEPFVELLKSSVCSFLNAFTYPDKTVYPIASQNEQDFYNLVDVYLDAVFYPKLSEYTFLQEGWHYEPADKGFIYKGVVFNEMKGSRLSPDRTVWQEIQSALFPDTPYRWDSGGVPEQIVELSYDEFRTFHTANYHPSNALIWMSGNDDLDKRLKTLDAYLVGFTKPKTSSSEITIQRWSSGVRKVVSTYPATTADKKQAFAVQSWVLTDNLDLETQIELSILEYLLIGTSTAPLRKALIDTGYGDDLAGGGLELDLRQKTFSVGLRGIYKKDAELVFAEIDNSLWQLAKTGFSSEAVLAALNTTEFGLRENNTGSFPQGLSMGLRVLRGWLYGADPMTLLSFEQPLQQVRKRLIEDQNYLQSMIKRYLLVNLHCVQLTLSPDVQLIVEHDLSEKRKLNAFSNSLSDLDAKKLRKLAAELETAQRTPDSEEALHTLPRLSVSDLRTEVEIVPTDPQTLAHNQGFVHELQTNGVVYIDFAWPTQHLNTEDVRLLPTYTTALMELGTKTFTEEQLQVQIDSRMGGLSTQVFVGQRMDSDVPAEYIILRMKALSEQLPGAFELIESILCETTWENKRRFVQIISEEKAQFEASLTDEGHQLVSTRVASCLTPAGAVSEQLRGFTQLEYLRELSTRIEKNWNTFEQSIRSLHTSIFQQPCVWNITTGAAELSQTKKYIGEFLEAMQSRQTKHLQSQSKKRSVRVGSENEALIMSSPVNYVAAGTRISTEDRPISGSALIATQLLRTDYLWNTVRVLGGAYGAGVRIEPISGVVVANSYRDPQLKKTIDVFDGMSTFLQKLVISDQELEKARIGTLGDLDSYKLPDARGFSALLHQLTGMTTKIRQQIRDEVFSTAIKDLHAVGALLGKEKHTFTAAITNEATAGQFGDQVTKTPLTTKS